MQVCSQSSSDFTNSLTKDVEKKIEQNAKSISYQPVADLTYKPIRSLVMASRLSPSSQLTPIISDHQNVSDLLTELNHRVADFTATVDEIGKYKLAKRSRAKTLYRNRFLSNHLQKRAEKTLSNKVLNNIKRLYQTGDDALLMIRRSLIEYFVNDSSRLEQLSPSQLDALETLAGQMQLINEVTLQRVDELTGKLAEKLDNPTENEKSIELSKVRSGKAMRDGAHYLKAILDKGSRATDFAEAVHCLKEALGNRRNEEIAESAREAWDAMLAATASGAPHDPRSQELFKRHYGKGPHRLRELDADEQLQCRQTVKIESDAIRALRNSRQAQRSYLNDIRINAKSNTTARLMMEPRPFIGAIRNGDGEYQVDSGFAETLKDIVDRGELVLMEHTLSTFPDGVKFIDVLHQVSSKPVLIAVHPQLVTFMQNFYDTAGLGMVSATPNNLKQAYEDQFGVMLFPGGTPSANVLSGECEAIDKASVTANRGLRSIWYAMQEGMSEIVIASVRDPVFQKRRAWGAMDGIRRFLIQKNIPATYLRSKGELGWGNFAYKRIRTEGEQNLQALHHNHLLVKYPLGEFSEQTRAAMPDKPAVLKTLLDLRAEHLSSGNRSRATRGDENRSNENRSSESREESRQFVKLSAKALGELTHYLNQQPKASLESLYEILPADQVIQSKDIRRLIKEDKVDLLIPSHIERHANELTLALDSFESHRLQIPGTMVYLYTVLATEDQAAERVNGSGQ